MAALLPHKGAGSPRRRRAGYRPNAEINVTPFVDVMLVLLIVFMVTAPLLTQGIPLNLPQTGGQSLSSPAEPLVVSVLRDGSVVLGGGTERDIVPLPQLIERLGAVMQANPEAGIYVRGDQDVPYGAFARVMGALTRAGFRNVSLVTLDPTTAGP